MVEEIKDMINYLIENWYLGIIESALVSALWTIYPTLPDKLSKGTLIFCIFFVFYLPGYLGLYGIYKKYLEPIIEEFFE
jgi:hypothetical protein